MNIYIRLVIAVKVVAAALNLASCFRKKHKVVKFSTSWRFRSELRTEPNKFMHVYKSLISLTRMTLFKT